MVVIFLQEANCKYHMTDRLPRYFSSQSLFFCLATDRDRVLRVLTVLSQFDSGDNPASSALGDHGRLTATSTPSNKSYSRTNVLSVCRSHVCLIHIYFMLLHKSRNPDQGFLFPANLMIWREARPPALRGPRDGDRGRGGGLCSPGPAWRVLRDIRD